MSNNSSKKLYGNAYALCEPLMNGKGK